MSELLRAVSSGFWAQYPIGTRLNWTFVSHQLNHNRIIISNAVSAAVALLISIARSWPVAGIPFFTHILDPVRQHAPSDSPAARVTYYVIAFSIGLVIVLGLGLAVALTLLAFALLPVIAVVAAGIWALVVLSLFCLWFGLYRYPVYEVIYPRLRRWILRHNSEVYSGLPRGSSVSRLSYVVVEPEMLKEMYVRLCQSP